MNDWVFQGDDLNWYFYDDDDEIHGPFEDEELARDGYLRYANSA